MEFRPIDIIQPGQYYRLRDGAKGWKPEYITDDRMYLVIECRHQTVKLLGIFPKEEKDYNQERTWTCTEDEFFEFSQEARDKRQKLLDEIVAAAHQPLTADEVPFLDIPLDWGDYSKYEPKEAIEGAQEDDEYDEDDGEWCDDDDEDS